MCIQKTRLEKPRIWPFKAFKRMVVIVMLTTVSSSGMAGIVFDQNPAPSPTVISTASPPKSTTIREDWLEPRKPEICNDGKNPNPMVRALLVGIGKYDHESIPPLIGPENDLNLIYSTIKRTGVKRIETLRQRVVADDFGKAWHTLLNESRCGDTFFLFLSGHNVDGANVLAFSDWGAKDQIHRPKTLTRESMERGVKALRTRGVNVFLAIDTMPSNTLLGIGRNPSWEWTPIQSGSPMQPEMGALGAYFGMYAGEASVELTLPPGSPDAKTFGLFSYMLATALGEAPDAPFKTIARQVFDRISTSGKKFALAPLFESTHPDRPALAVGLPGTKEVKSAMRGSDTRQIEISSPALSRGASRVATNKLAIEGRVVAPTLPVSIEANATLGKVLADGSFRIEVPVKEGQSRIAVTAWWSDTDFLPKSFTVVSQADQKVLSEGKRYAVIFASQDYKGNSFEQLSTPIADARALSGVLENRYGFATNLRDQSGQQTPLVFENATRSDILRTLSALRRNIGPDDSVVVFYAGHGHYDKVADRAYWLPVDAERDEDSTWVSADDVNANIQRLNAKHVLVISDSCYSGAFRQRSADSKDPTAKDRLQFLDQAMLRASRSFISSGASEPVSDGGGGGHSVFARALLDGLNKEHQAVTAGELFSRHLQQGVGGKSGQLPQYFPLKNGHEGGEFVFVPQSSEKP